MVSGDLTITLSASGLSGPDAMETLMRRFLTFLIALWAVVFAAVSSTSAQGVATIPNIAQLQPAPSYQGPGDVTAGAKMWWGLRAYSAATAGNKVANVCNSTGGTDVGCADMLSSATTGQLVPATIGGITCPGANCTVKILYDQTAGNNCTAGTCDVSQATVASRPTLDASCIGSLPCMNFHTAPLSLATAANATAVAAPYTYVGAAIRTGTASVQTISRSGSSGIYFANAANSGECVTGANNVVSGVADNAWHAFIMVDTTSSSNTACIIDGTTTNFANQIGFGGGILTIGTDTFSQPLKGEIVEVGVWPSSLTSVATTMNSNIHTFWGF
jgi:hypothetical protein